MVTIEKCPCGHPTCKYYGVSNGTFYQGCGWDEETAQFVADCFNYKESVDAAIQSRKIEESIWKGPKHD